MIFRSARPVGLVCLLAFLACPPAASAQDIVVSSATPSSAEQGTISLDVRIGGKGFKRGAIATFLRSGTNDPDGIRVNATTYVSSTELVANITVAAEASISSFDIEVMSSGRKGKGTEMFAVTAPNPSASGATCTLPASDPNFTLVTTLNAAAGPGPQASGGFGVHVAVGRGTLPSSATPGNVLVAAIGSAASAHIEMLILDPTTGAVLRRLAATPDPSLVLGTRSLAAGQINGDGLPDFALGDPALNVVFALLSRTDLNGELAYSAVKVPRPSGSTGSFGWELELGDLDGDGRDELAVSVDVSGSGKKANPASLALYSFVSVTGAPTYLRSLSLPGTLDTEANMRAIAIADVDGITGNDVIVGSPRKDEGATNSGAVYVYSGGGPLVATLRANVPRTDDTFGRKVRAGDLDGNGLADLVVSTGWQGPDIRADVVRGSLTGMTSASTPDGTLAMRPSAGLGEGWSTTNPATGDITGDGLADVIVGAPNATVGRCTSPGAAFVFVHNGSAAPAGYTLWAPTPDPDFAAFGWSVASVDASPVILITEHGRDVGGIRNAGQVYIYRYNPQ